MDKTKLYSINTFGKANGVSRTTLMRFEEEGLLTPAYKDEYSGYRYYDDDNATTLQQILRYQRLGFTKKEIKAYS